MFQWNESRGTVRQLYVSSISNRHNRSTVGQHNPTIQIVTLNQKYIKIHNNTIDHFVYFFKHHYNTLCKYINQIRYYFYIHKNEFIKSMLG